MKVYTVEGMDKIDYDFSVEIFKLGCFLDRDKALQKAKEEFEKFKVLFEEEIKKYGNEKEYPDEEYGALYIEEDYDGGYYQISFGFEKDYEVHCIGVDEWTVED